MFKFAKNVSREAEVRGARLKKWFFLSSLAVGIRFYNWEARIFYSEIFFNYINVESYVNAEDFNVNNKFTWEVKYKLLFKNGI